MIHTNCFTDILSGEGGSVSAESETVNLSEGGQAAGAQAAAYDGYVFTNWTAADGTVVSSSDYFVPVLTPDMTGEITYTAHFEKKAVEAPATRMVTAEYVAGKGGSVSRASDSGGCGRLCLCKLDSRGRQRSRHRCCFRSFCQPGNCGADSLHCEL